MFPTPQDPKGAPVWRNYIVAQTAQAMLGIIPVHALAVGVAVGETLVTLKFQLSDVTEMDLVDIEDVRAALEDLLGGAVDVQVEHELLQQRRISPTDGIEWVFLARVD